MDNKKTAEKMPFWQLLQNSKIEIPIIQRDYAQGRPEQIKVRERFLNTLHNTLEFSQGIELDFIYGSQVDDTMQPLDGQQRLTTLYLLHWYFAKKANLLSEFKKFFKNFSYETRISSREFCEALVSENIDIDHLQSTDKLSEIIIDRPWFFLSWKNDPTISAMLNMLDAIHHKFYNIEQGWQKLTDTKLIQFYHLDLDNFGLSDDLYIKMNARGKPLTTFENFKALLEKQISVDNWEEKSLIPTEKFAYKIDNTWTDLLWCFRDENDLFDDGFLQLISNIYLITRTKKENIQQISNEPTLLMPGMFDKNSFDYLVQTLDSYSRVDFKQLNSSLPMMKYLHFKDINYENFFELIVKSEGITYPQRVMFFAQTSYLNINAKFDSDNFADWMRVIRNVVNNSTIDNDESFIGALGLVRELAQGSNDIYKYLSENSVISKFASKQVEEEGLKAKTIIVSMDNKQPIHQLEDTKFCQGRIKFALDCLATFDPTQLNKIRTNVVEKYFNANDITNDIRRVLLTIGDNKFYYYWGSWLYALNQPKRCLIANAEDLKKSLSEYNYYLKELTQLLVDNHPAEVIADYQIPKDMPNWKKRLIQEPGLLEKSKQHYVAISRDDSRCWLIPLSRVANSDEGRLLCEEVI
ncbi:DUF262 domain-containing protein [Acinetobacter towneri]|uniref:DUF262 domain-containing protein n=1 Tax=Acinetobacter towneri TaxID=202956 RepID=UPI00209B76F2|nr:DUF262 domain-containing protein [Acinetobacter towneri]MCO8057329.1 DUF262 domain-containing protein [Acinetobacter towneri]